MAVSHALSRRGVFVRRAGSVCCAALLCGVLPVSPAPGGGSAYGQAGDCRATWLVARGWCDEFKGHKYPDLDAGLRWYELAFAAADHYDAWNRLVKLEDPGSGTVVATYAYNGVGHRVQKTVGGAGGDTYDTYYNQDWQALEVRKNGGLHPYEQFVYDGGYIDAPFMRYVDADTDGTLGGDMDSSDDGEQYYLRDASFNVVALLDEAGAALERYLYTPYGQRVVLGADFTPNANNTTGYGQQRGFQGLRHDEESGLIENRNRMLDPTTGRFLQRDPLGYPDGMNGYAAYHVLMGGLDPDGEAFWIPVIVIVVILTIPGDEPVGPPVEGAINCAIRVKKEEGWAVPAPPNYPGGGDKYNHCRVACEVEKQCGPFVSWSAGLVNEILDVGGTGFSCADLAANTNGRKCADVAMSCTRACQDPGTNCP